MGIQDLCRASEDYSLIGLLACEKKMSKNEVNLRNLNDEL